MIAIIDYGAGNLFSVKNALDFLGEPNIITADKGELARADGLILPGVGAFPDAMSMLTAGGLLDTVREQARQKPFLGICLGMQLLFAKGYEFEETDGLGLIDGSVVKIQAPGLRIPHIGWNRLERLNDCPLLDGLSDDEYVYFVHSFRADCADDCVAAYCDYGERIPALVFRGHIFGAQFHPEKSGETGLQILRNFGELLK